MIEAVGIGCPSGHTETYPAPPVVLLSTVTVSETAVASSGTPQRPRTPMRTTKASRRVTLSPARSSASRHGGVATNRAVDGAASACDDETDTPITATEHDSSAQLMTARTTTPGVPPGITQRYSPQVLQCQHIRRTTSYVLTLSSGGGGVEGPVVLGVATGHLLAHIDPTAVPEPGQVGGDLDRPVGRRQEMEHDRTPGCSGVRGGAEQVLHAGA